MKLPRDVSGAKLQASLRRLGYEARHHEMSVEELLRELDL